MHAIGPALFRASQSHASECGSAANVAAGGYFGQEKVKKLARH
jgi:hypothetical protein